MTVGTQFAFEILFDDRVVPVVDAVIDESRAGGWEIALYLSTGLESPEVTFVQMMSEGLYPGRGVDLHLTAKVPGHDAVVVRRWPSVVTSSSASPRYGQREAVGVLTLCDPITALSSRALWGAWSGTSLAEVLGGAVSGASGGSGSPTLEPIGFGDITLVFESRLRAAVETVPYVIACGQPFSSFLAEVLAEVGARLEMVSEEDGRIRVFVVDALPHAGPLNEQGPLRMRFDYELGPSAGNLVPDPSREYAMHARRIALVDNVHLGEPRPVAAEGAVESVLTAACVDLEEGLFRSAFRADRESLAQVAFDAVSRQPGFLPGRLVRVDPSQVPGAGAGALTWFGASLWQAGFVSHVYTRGTYFNLVSFDKSGRAWRPAAPPPSGPRFASVVVDDRASDPGARVSRDPLGRVPVRFAAGGWLPGELNGDAPAEVAAGGARWPALIRLSSVVSGAGAGHGAFFVHRQGDWGRISVMTPFHAEYLGSVFRDDRPWRDDVSDTTFGWLTRQDVGEPRGFGFQPDETLPEVFDPDDGLGGEAAEASGTPDGTGGEAAEASGTPDGTGGEAAETSGTPDGTGSYGGMQS